MNIALGPAPQTTVVGPDFMCIGAQKGGTQWLYDQVAMHPQVWMPAEKELHFFDESVRIGRIRKRLKSIVTEPDRLNRSREKHNRQPLDDRDRRFLEHAATWNGTADDIEWYVKLFEPKRDLVSGDITPAYSGLEPETIGRIGSRFPQLKVIFLARDPVDRAWSAFQMTHRHQRKRGDEPKADWQSVQQFIDRERFRVRSLPSRTVENWRRTIPEQRFFLGFFDDMRDDSAAVWSNIRDFLGLAPVEDTAVPADYNRKSGRSKIAMTDEIRDGLVAYFADELRRGRDVLGGPAARWCERYGIY